MVRPAVLLSCVAALVLAGCGVDAERVRASTAGVPPVTTTVPPTSVASTTVPATTLPPTTLPPTTLPPTTLPPTTLPPTTLPPSTVPPTTVPPRSPQLLLVGDSVMKAVELYGNPAASVLGALGWQVTVDAEESRFPDAGIGVLQQRRSQVGDVVVIQLSNNYGGDPERWRAQVERMLQVLDGVPEVYFLTVSEFRPDRREVNDVLRQVAALDPRVRVVDWNAVAGAVPGLLARDRLHLTPLGAQAMAEVIGQAIGAPSSAG